MLEFLGPAINLASQIWGQRSANRAVSRYNVPTGAEKRTNALYEAILNPNSGLLQQLSQQERDQAQSAFLSQLREMQLADRRAQAMGRAPTFFNPERADESINFLTSRGLPMLNAIASERAQNRVTGAATGIGGLIPQQVARNTVGMKQGVSNAAYLSQMPNYLLNAIMGGYNAPQKNSTYSNNLGWIDWNRNV